MSVDDQTGRPLYRQVADDLRRQIQRHELTPGGQLPTEAQLMDRYDVSRNTVRLALGVLRTEGLVVTGQGRGSFVADVRAAADGAVHRPRRQVGRTVGVPSIELAEPGDHDRLEVAVVVRPAPAPVTARLGLDPADKTVERRRLLYRDGAPSYMAHTHVPARLAADSTMADPAPLADGVAAVLARLGRPVVRYRDEASVRMPQPGEAQELQIATGVPVLELHRTGYDVAAVAVCVTVAVLPGDRHTLRYDVEPLDGPADGDGRADDDRPA